LNGYPLTTNPLLEQEDIISFDDFSSCGTSTAISVPCLFSVFPKNDFTLEKANATENLLDILTHAGTNVLWRDNNSDSKGVALRVNYENFKTPKTNTICDTECRDEGMLIGLQDYINQQDQGDIVIVLHQMGNHGPAYYKRYPQRFEQFKPTCKTNQLEDCTLEEIGNTYDNAILYTDYFLAKTINLLKNNSKNFETAMFYVSDHGESLGEHGLYLHGLPYMIAPESQTHVGAMMWFSPNFKINRRAVKSKKSEPFSHDNVFHTVLGLLNINSKIYQQEMDILNN
jgi:lipid A ethanolaminephosphotransferase